MPEFKEGRMRRASIRKYGREKRQPGQALGTDERENELRRGTRVYFRKKKRKGKLTEEVGGEKRRNREGCQKKN